MTTSLRAQPGRADWPDDPIVAVTHADPYPYYAWLAAEQPLYYDDRIGLWVASGTAAVKSVLASDICHVRPPSEIVPRRFQGSALAEIFGHLVRMNEGQRHDPLKRAVGAAMMAVDETRLAEIARERSGAVLQRTQPQSSRSALTDFMLAFPVEVVARLAGVPADRAEEVGSWIRRYVITVGPLASEAEVESGKDAARHLIDFVRGLLARPGELEQHTLFAALATGARETGCHDQAAIVANGIGFMSQTYEATAALTGNSLLALSDGNRLQRGSLGDLVREVMRIDSPAQNTRRFVASDGIVAGQARRQGDTILVLLAAANLGFGFGRHACPADNLAVQIAACAVAALLDAGVDPIGLREDMTYLPSVAVRLPLFGQAARAR